MARVPSTIDRIMSGLDPQTTANAVYEMMMLWHAVDEKIGASPKGQRPIIFGQREAYEKCLSLFLGVSPREVRILMRNHYGRNQDG